MLRQSAELERGGVEGGREGERERRERENLGQDRYSGHVHVQARLPGQPSRSAPLNLIAYPPFHSLRPSLPRSLPASLLTYQPDVISCFPASSCLPAYSTQSLPRPSCSHSLARSGTGKTFQAGS